MTAAVASREVTSRWFSLRAVLLHLAMALAVGICGSLAYWQVLRATGGNGLSWAYVFEWPFFGGVAVYAWWDLIHHPHKEAPKGDPKDVLPPGWFRMKAKGELAPPRPAVGDGRRGGEVVPAGEREWVQVGDTAVAPPDPGHLQPIDLEEAAKLEAYNRYLADLNANGKPKRW